MSSRTVHGQRELTDRRSSNHELITYYQQQATLAARGHSTRRTAEFYQRQVQYFRLFGG